MTNSLMQWFLASTLAMAAALALRWLTKNRIPFRARYALWSLALLRMLCPRFLGASPISAASLALGLAPAPAETVQETPAALSAYGAPASSPAFSRWLPLLWALGAAVVLFCLLTSNLVFRRRLSQIRRPMAEEGCPLPLYQAPGLASPLLLGLFRPAVYLPESIPEQAKPYALAHELTHWRHGDQLWSLLRCLALALHWYNPLAWLCASLSRLDGELACDEGALARLGREKRLDYGRALTDLAEQAAQKGGPLWGSAMGGKPSWLARRVEALIHQPKVRRPALFCSAITLLALAPVLFLGPGGRLSPQQAMAQLKESVSYQQGGVTFTLPAGYPAPEDWNIHIAGRAVYPDGFSRSVHFFDSENQTHSWQAGQRYMIAIDEPAGCVDLTMEVWLPDGHGGRCYLSLSLFAADSVITS